MKPLRERILDAAWRTTCEQGWAAVTMAGLGDGAGVSRQSVYNEFGSKQHVAEALVGREVARFLEAVDEEVAVADSPTQAVQAAAGVVFAMAAENPLLHSMLSAAAGGTSSLLPLLTSQAQPFIDTAADRLGRGLSARFDDLPPPRELAVALDTIVRVVLSRVVQPGRAEASDVGFVAGRLLAPVGVDQAFHRGDLPPGSG